MNKSSLTLNDRQSPAKPSAKSSDILESKMYADIYAAVMEHRLLPRTKLTEQALAEIYHLARHSVRKVLSQLASDGLVDLHANRGAFIADPSEQEAKEMFEMRQALEQLVLEKILEKPEISGLDRIETMVQRERSAFHAGEKSTWIRLSADFHLELARLCGNQILSDSLRRLVSRTTLIIAGVQTAGQGACSFDEHEQILVKLKAGDKVGALKCMKLHLAGCASRSAVANEKHFDLRAALQAR